MCGWPAAIARPVVSFLDAVLVGCFLSWFRPRSGPSSCPGTDRPRDRLGVGEVSEVIWVSDDENEEAGFEESGESREDLAHEGGVDEELRLECDDMLTNAMGGTSVSETCPSERFKCEDEDIEHLPRVQSIPLSAFQEKPPFWSIKSRLTDSPLATPLVLRDDMQTPGTIYTSHKGSSTSRKRVRTRKQFVYPVLRPIENKLHQLELTEDSSPMLPSNTPKRRNLGADSMKMLQQISSNSVAKAGSSKSFSPNNNVSYQENETHSLEGLKCQISSPNLLHGREISKSNSGEKHAALSLTRWLEHSYSDIEKGDANSYASDQLHDQNMPFTENHIFTSSGIDWDIENPTPRLPKAWNGNGIPNTTTKYMENQKVSWHTTPFEERLLKVLSDEGPPRELVRGNLFHAEES